MREVGGILLIRFHLLESEIVEPEKNEIPESGTARYEYPDGSIYEGEWKDGLWNGTGEYKSSYGWEYKGDFDELISEKQSLIEDMEQYKRSLIYEAVTGKRKVV